MTDSILYFSTVFLLSLILEILIKCRWPIVCFNEECTKINVEKNKNIPINLKIIRNLWTLKLFGLNKVFRSFMNSANFASQCMFIVWRNMEYFNILWAQWQRISGYWLLHNNTNNLRKRRSSMIEKNATVSVCNISHLRRKV